jgi:hypothetical protein
MEEPEEPYFLIKLTPTINLFSDPGNYLIINGTSEDLPKIITDINCYTNVITKNVELYEFLDPQTIYKGFSRSINNRILRTVGDFCNCFIIDNFPLAIQHLELIEKTNTKNRFFINSVKDFYNPEDPNIYKLLIVYSCDNLELIEKLYKKYFIEIFNDISEFVYFCKNAGDFIYNTTTKTFHYLEIN